jgi:hypothetical protein
MRAAPLGLTQSVLPGARLAATGLWADDISSRPQILASD